MKNIKLLSFTFALAGTVLGQAQTAPPAINYQGRLTQATGVVVPDGLTGMRVRIFATASGGSALWDSGDLSVATKSGTFSILLGSGGMPAMSPDVFAFGTVYLEVQVAGQAPLLPRQPIATVPWAFYAQTVSNGAITTIKLADSSVTNAKIVNLDWSKLTGVPTSFPPTGSAGGDLTGTYPNPAIGAGKVDTTKLADSSVTNAKIANDSVTSTKIASDQSSFAKITGGRGAISAAGLSATGTVAYFEGAGNSTGALFNRNQNGGNTWTLGQYPDYGGDNFDLKLHRRYGGGDQGLALVVQASTGNIGVGTTNPQTRLDVNGNGYFSGNVGIGTTNPNGHRLSVGGNMELGGAIIGSNGFLVVPDVNQISFNPLSSWNTVRFSGTNFVISSQWTGVFGEPEIGFRLKCHGPLYATSFHTTFDRRAKTDLQEINRPLHTLLQLHGVNFRFKKGLKTELPSGLRYGFIAQDVERVIPQWVTNGAEYKTLSTSEFDALATEAIREQQDQIENLRKENERLRSQNAGFEARLRKLEAKCIAK